MRVTAKQITTKGRLAQGNGKSAMRMKFDRVKAKPLCEVLQGRVVSGRSVFAVPAFNFKFV